MSWLLALTTGALFGVGTWMLLQRDTLRLVLGLSLLLGAANLFLFGCGVYTGSAAPYVSTTEASVDPVPQALVLTAIVIGFGVVGFLAALVLTIARRMRTMDVDAVSRLKG